MNFTGKTIFLNNKQKKNLTDIGNCQLKIEISTEIVKFVTQTNACIWLG